MEAQGVTTATTPDMLDAPARKRPYGQLALGIGISILCLWFTFRKIDLHEVGAALSQLHWRYVAYGVLSLAIGYALRIARWATMLRAAGAATTNKACAAPFLGSIALNNVLPFRAGDLVRAFIFPSALGVSRITATASLIFERLIDLSTLLVALGIGMALTSELAVPAWLSHTAFTLSMLCLVGGAGVLLGRLWLLSLVEGLMRRAQAAGKDRHAKLLNTVHALMRAVTDMAGPRTLTSILLLSGLIWMAEAGLFWSLLLGLGLPLAYGAGLMVMAMTTLSTLVPSSPGYVGPFHLAAATAVGLLGADQAHAASFAVLAHLCLWLPTTLAGTLAILLRPRLFKMRPTS